MADIIQLRRDTSTNWITANPVLAQGELGLETNTRKIKVGDGSTPWNSLLYYDLGTILSEVIFTGSIREQTYQITDAVTIFIEPGNGSIQYLTSIGASRTINTSLFLDGEVVTLMINDNSGTGSVSTWTSVSWINNGGVAPLWPDSGTYTVISLWKVNGTVYGAVVGNGT
jgi:hypothetical protein